jgi:hypothetical protein
MRYLFIVLAATVHLAATGAVHAQQQQFGRDSVYPTPGKPITPLPATAEPIHRSGRDSLYVMQLRHRLSPPSSGVATGPVRYGRGSVYAHRSPNAPATTPTQVGSGALGQGG